MVFVHLDYEQKLQVIVVALALLLGAILCSLCLALASCPLNRWLLERDSKRRRRARDAPAPANWRDRPPSYRRAAGAGELQAGRIGPCAHSPAKRPWVVFGSPPAYEDSMGAAPVVRPREDHATIDHWAPGKQFKNSSISGPNIINSASNNNGANNNNSNNNSNININSSRSNISNNNNNGPCSCESSRPTATARKGARSRSSGSGGEPASKQRAAARQQIKLRLWVRLLEPAELIERARQLAPAACGQGAHSEGGARARTPPPSRRGSLSRQLSIPQLLGSLASLTTPLQSAAANLAWGAAARPDHHHQHHLDEQLEQQQQQLEQRHQQAHEPAESSHARLGADAIASRVLYMNVASFSYARDEALVSARRHQQLNYQHLGASSCFKRAPLRELAGAAPEPTSAPPGAGGAKQRSLQLFVAICDLDGLVGSGALERRACWRLADTSALCVRCDLVAAPVARASSRAASLSTARRQAARLLACGSRGFSPDKDERQLAAETEAPGERLDYHFGSRMPAAAVEPQPALAAARRAAAANEEPGPAWRHVPHVQGEPVVSFCSLPKRPPWQANEEAAGANDHDDDHDGHYDERWAADGEGHGGADEPLIQFDSVFVSPILAQSLLERAHLRLRVEAQCRYANDSCLAELSLPLSRLLASATRDNLELAPANQARAEQVFDGLLGQLVSASSGLPLLEQLAGQTTACLAANWPRPAPSPRFSWAAEAPLASVWHTGVAECPLGASCSAAEHQGELEARQLELNLRRSVAVSEWLNYLAAPGYECAPMEEPRADVVLGLTYLPTSNRVVFNVDRARLPARRSAPDCATCYLVRLHLLAGGRLLKRRETRPASEPEWDSQEALTFELSSLPRPASRPHFLVALVQRRRAASRHHHHAGSSMQNLALDSPASRLAPTPLQPLPSTQSEPDQLVSLGAAGRPRRRHAPSANDQILGHVLLGAQVWRELRAQPRRQIVRRFGLY